MIEAITYVTGNWDAIGGAILAVIGAAATIAALTPTAKDDGAVAVLRKIVDVIGMNVGNAKNLK